MVVVAAVKAGEQHFAFVDRGIEFTVTIDIGVNDQIGRAGDDDLVVDDGHAERGEQACSWTNTWLLSATPSPLVSSMTMMRSPAGSLPA